MTLSASFIEALGMTMLHPLPDLIGKRINCQQAGGISYTGTFLGLGEKKGHRCVLIKLKDGIYFVPLDWVSRVSLRPQEV